MIMCVCVCFLYRESVEERVSGTQFVYYLAEVGYSFLMEEAFSVDRIDMLLLSSVWGGGVTSPCGGRRPADPLQGEFHLSEVFTNI